MKLALLVGANPRVSEGGPVVKLHEGDWRIIHEGVKDSTLSHDDGALILSRGTTSVQIQFGKRGTEQFVSVYAELQPQS